MRNSFADYKSDGANWITLASGEYYPDILKDACALYEPVQVMFGQLLARSESSVRLFLQIADVQNSWTRVQLARVFRKYVSPETPVEMLKKEDESSRDLRPIREGFSTNPSSSGRIQQSPHP
jgi:hypothetical protein